MAATQPVNVDALWDEETPAVVDVDALWGDDQVDVDALWDEPAAPPPITKETSDWADNVSSHLKGLHDIVAGGWMDIEVGKGKGADFDKVQNAQNEIDAYEKSLLENAPWHPKARQIIARTNPIFEHEGSIYDTETAQRLPSSDPRVEAILREFEQVFLSAPPRPLFQF